MAAHASIFDQLAHDQRAPSKQKWREKFFSNEGKTKKLAQLEKSEQDVDEFLRPSSSRSSSKPSLDLPVPRIDISNASRWPSATEVPSIPPLKPGSPQKKTPRREGLHVAFIATAPDIIGEGGDEAELPAIAVSRSKSSSIGFQSLQSDSAKQGARSAETSTNDGTPNASLKPPLLNDDDSHRPMVLQRRPTGLDDRSTWKYYRGGPQDPSLSKSDVSIHSAKTQEQSPDLPSTPKYIKSDYSENDQRGENGEAPHNDTDPQTISHHEHDYPVELTKLLVPPMDFGISLSNSLTPMPSPSPSINHPSSTIPKITGQPLRSDYFQPAYEQTYEKSHRESPRSETKSLKPLSDSRPISIRSLAKNLGDDALHDFGSSVERFYGIFQLGAAAISPLMEVSFTQWIRTAAFWFLKGRGRLEVAVRLNGRSPTEANHSNGPESFRGLEQAYLDLAKALWIVEKITPNHPEPKRFGHTGMSSLMAIVASFGEKKLAEQIGVHLAIIANMRALAMSMKRNERLPTASFDIRGLDTRIFMTYPVLSSGVANLFSNHSRSLIVDDSRDGEMFLPLLVSDTKRHFLYSTYFVDLILAAPNDAREQIIFPCALSLLRERTARDLKVVIASQDGQINIIIQSSGKDGLTWEEVQWKIKSHNLGLKLSEAVHVQVQFSEKDFKTLWGIHDYTRTIHEGLQCGKDETEVFSTELPLFQSLDQDNSKLFPTESIKMCSLRLFEKKRTLQKGSRGLKHYDGHRLVVVTPSDMKTLSSINLECGKQKPILFSFLRGEGSAPALLLKFFKPSPISSMVITFDETKGRGFFHSLLNGTSIAVTESCSQPLPLRSFTMSKTQSEDFGSVSGKNFLNNVHWEQLRVIDSDIKGPSHGTPRIPEYLRIWVEGEIGSFVDHVNLGQEVTSQY